jgi:hypothetical protein
MANRADQYRRLAGDCLALADSMSTEDARRSLIEMAQVWTRLAEEQENVFAPIPVSGALHAAVQQQQQIQPKNDGTKQEQAGCESSGAGKDATGERR